MPESLTVTWTLSDTCCAGVPTGLARTEEMVADAGDADCCQWHHTVGSGDSLDCPENTGDPNSGPGLGFIVKFCASTRRLTVEPIGLDYCQPTAAFTLTILECVEGGAFQAEGANIPMQNGCAAPCGVTMDITITGT